MNGRHRRVAACTSLVDDYNGCVAITLGDVGLPLEVDDPHLCQLVLLC
jgi:hypothetical protein